MIYVICPHCSEPIIIEKLNCGIFRHGMYKKSGKQIHPHLSKSKCIQLLQKKQIVGCGKPFRVVSSENTHQAIVCDYI